MSINVMSRVKFDPLGFSRRASGLRAAPTCAISHPEEPNKPACFFSQRKLSAILVRHVDSDRFKNISFSGGSPNGRPTKPRQIPYL